MNYNLSDFLTSIKLNTHKFEELSFAGSYFTMPKKELSNVLFAEINNDENQTVNIEDNPLKDSYIEVDDGKKTLMDKIKETISNIFKPKPKTYKLTDGQSIEIDGTMPGNPIAKFFNKIADSLDKFTNKGKEIKEATATINEPQIISKHPAVITDKTKPDQNPTLLNAPKVPNPDLVFPGKTGKINTTGSYIDSKPAPEIAPEAITVDKEAVLRENKDMIAGLLKESDSRVDKQETTVEPAAPSREENSDDFVK